MKHLQFSIVAACLALASTAAHGEIKVVTSIKPIHSLVAGVMEGVGAPSLIVQGAASPHVYSLKPSQAAQIETADVIFWLGAGVSNFMQKPIQTIAQKAHVVTLLDVPGLTRIPWDRNDLDRHGDAAANNHRDDHDEHENEDEHEEAHRDEHENEDEHKQAHNDEREDGDHEHSHAGTFNTHVWLDPQNAKVIVGAIARALSETDPANSAIYARNADNLLHRLDDLTEEVQKTLTPVKGKTYIVFHDAYPYFEQRFGLASAGAITLNPEIKPGAERISKLLDNIARLDVVCAFSEPQFPSQLVATVTQGSSARAAILDPLGATLEDGRELYFHLIRNMAASMRGCLSAAR